MVEQYMVFYLFFSFLANSSAGCNWVLSSPPMLTSRESQYMRHAPYPSPTLHHKGADPSEYSIIMYSIS